VAVLFSDPLVGGEKIELWSGDGPGSRGSVRLAGFPAVFEGRAAYFALRVGVPWSPPRLTAVFAAQHLVAQFEVLEAAAFEAQLVAGVLKVYPCFASCADDKVLRDRSGKTLQVTVEEHRSLVTEIVRVPIDVVQLPPPSSDNSLMRALGGSTSLLPGATPDGQTVHVWESRVVGREMMTLPTLVVRYREQFDVPRGLDLMMRISHRTSDSDVLSAGMVPVDPRFRVTVVAREAKLATSLLDDGLLAALDHLLEFPGTRRVIIDRLGLRTSISTNAFTRDTSSDWLVRVLEVSQRLGRALTRLG
jgi:hypothetical protein